MKPSHPKWLERILGNWSFYWSNFRISFILISISILLIAMAVYLNYPLDEKKGGDYLFSFGYSLLLIGMFSVMYEVRTREAFLKMLSEINPNIESGVTVHPSHLKVIARDAAINTYLQNKDIVRIRTSTADHYVRDREPAHEALIDKIKNSNCKLRILLYLPVFQDEMFPVGQHSDRPETVINTQKNLLDSYRYIINIAPSRVAIKFFFSPVNVNFIMLGNDRMFSSLIPNRPKSGINTPCFEIFPTGSRSLFFQFQHEFDAIFYSDGARESIGFDKIEPLLKSFDGDVPKFRASLSTILDK